MADISKIRLNGSNYNVKDTTARKLVNPNTKNMSNRKFLFIGDSYTQVPTPATSTVGKVAEKLGLKASQYTNIGVSGVDMAGYILEVSGYSGTDTASYTDVVIIGGINDAHTAFSSSSLATQIPQLCNDIKTKFRNATIWAGWCGNLYLTPTIQHDYPNFTYSNIRAIKYLWDYTFSSQPGVIYMNNLDLWIRTISDTDFYDGGSGLHPRGFGIDVLSSNIANYLKGAGNVCHNLTEVPLDISFYHSVSASSGGGPIVLTCQGDYNEVVFPALGVNFTTDINFGASWTTLYTWTPNAGNELRLIQNRTVTTISVPVTYKTSAAPAVPVTVMAVVEFTNTTVRINCPNMLSAVSIHSLWMPEFKFFVPRDAG